MALGDFKTTAQSIGRSQTSSNTYQAKAQLVTPVLTAGDYLVVVSFLYQTDTFATNELQARLVLDSVTTVYETGELREANPGTAVGDSQDAAYFEVFQTLAAGSHTFDLEYRRTGVANPVTIEQVRIQFFGMDGTYLEALADGHTFTNSTTYQLKTTLNTGGAIPAGVYRLRLQAEYNATDATSLEGLRLRMRRDPFGANVITNLLGDDAGQPKELAVNQNGWGIFSTDPRGYAAWERACLELENDEYTFELHYRAVNGVFKDVGIALARLAYWQVS